MLLGEGAHRSEACGEQNCSKNAPKRAGIILIYGDMVFHATTVMVNEAGLSCFLLRSGRLERIAEKTGGIFLEDCSQHPTDSSFKYKWWKLSHCQCVQASFAMNLGSVSL